MTYKLPEPFYKEWSAYTVAEVQETADAATAAREFRKANGFTETHGRQI